MAAKREVAESSFDLLHHSIVDTFTSASRTHPERDLENVGFNVGQKLAERYSRDRPIFADDLQAITFLCKDFWTEVYGKQMDKLRTNHKGVFELQDHLAPEANAGEAAKRYLLLPCGMIRGALAALGILATVRAEAQGLPSVVFVIHVRQPLRSESAAAPAPAH
ncbi:NO signaling/Golgi transport ligand-binding domain-containing protein [Baffinella frigidus]|nr:NO signaling/Golgi transport ligand-binding domain-containing protein [Cryptophyta sp. CCMP2293]